MVSDTQNPERWLIQPLNNVMAADQLHWSSGFSLQVQESCQAQAFLTASKKALVSLLASPHETLMSLADPAAAEWGLLPPCC